MKKQYRSKLTNLSFNLEDYLHNKAKEQKEKEKTNLNSEDNEANANNNE